MKHNVVLSGHGFRLEPLGYQHVSPLLDIIDADLWSGMSAVLPVGEVGIVNYIEDIYQAPDVMSFAVVDLVSGATIGSTAFCGINDDQKRIEIGRTFYDRKFWGCVVNPACKYLMLSQAFDSWGMKRVSLRADSRNLRSISAITKLGATYEGTMRGFRFAADGSRVDSMVFSILYSEWLNIKPNLLARINPLQVASLPKLVADQD